jgi:DNA-binding transcriptional regulator YiaG
MSNMNKESIARCEVCGSALVGYKHTEQVGKVKVTDGTALKPYCEKCGGPNLTLDELAGYERRAAALVLRDGRHVDGAVLKYARKALGLKQTNLAAILQCQPETLSRWETGALVMRRAEQLELVALLDNM